MALNTYFDFAEDDFQYLQVSYQNGQRANSMGSMAQAICERYMKHIINLYYQPSNDGEQYTFEQMLRAHSLKRLMNFLEDEMGIQFSQQCKADMRDIDGYYFSTRYPGDDSIALNGTDIDQCIATTKACRDETIAICEQLEAQIYNTDVEEYDEPEDNGESQHCNPTVDDDFCL